MNKLIKKCYEKRYGVQKYKYSVLYLTFEPLVKDIIFEAKKEMIDEVKIMVNDCIKKGLATEFILLQGIPTIEKRHLPNKKTNKVKNVR